MSSPHQKTPDELLKRDQRQSRGRAPSGGERSATDDVAEQQPIMRSIAINPLTQQRRLHFEAPLRRAEPVLKSSLAPLRGASNPELLKSAPLKRETLKQRRSHSESSLARKWHVDHAALPGRPTDFPLLKTTRTVMDTPAHVISNRISDCLQSRSIRTKFSKSESNLARCRNTDYCKFSVRLYAGDEGGVLVEVQRLCGDAMSFMRDCRALLDAAAGKTAGEQVKEEKPLYLRLPVSEMSFVKECKLPAITPEDEAESVNVAADLLSSPMSDSNMLGMESLAIMTDPRKTARGTAILASRRILCPQDPGNGGFNLHNHVMSLVIFQDPQEDDDEEAQDAVLTGMDDHQCKLRTLAMTSLHNALSLLSAEDLLRPVLSRQETWYATVLVPKLVADLGGAERSPHDACYASRCLSLLAECSRDCEGKMAAGGVAEALKLAEGVGKREFDLLRKDAGSALKALRCC